jgi:dihydrofolate reductase
MRDVLVSEFLSLVGVMEDPVWTAPYWNEEIANFKFHELFASDALLLGRVTYQGFSAAWPSRRDEQGYADRMNKLPKFVVSSTLAQAEWNNSFLLGQDFLKRVSKMKHEPGGDILIFGSGMLANSLMQHGLVDRYNLLIYPLVLGKGRRLFDGGFEDLKLKLTHSKSFSSGVVLFQYGPEASPA